jgi:uncharacterized membrane protein YdjX (TVP38/TMEM64 family)
MADSSAQTTDPEPLPNAGNDQTPPELQQPAWKQLAVMALVVLALLATVYFSPLRAYLSHWKEMGNDIRNQIRSFGALAPFVLTCGVALLVAVGFPRLVLCMIAGVALGFWSGLLWAQLGTLIGNYGLFILVRTRGSDWARQFLSRRTWLAGLIREQGVLGVILARQLPLPGALVNFACALLAINDFDFLLGTVIGQLPQAIPCTLIGAGVLEPSFRRSVGLIGLAVFIAVLAWIGLRFFLRRLLQRKRTNE